MRARKITVGEDSCPTLKPRGEEGNEEVMRIVKTPTQRMRRSLISGGSSQTRGGGRIAANIFSGSSGSRARIGSMTTP